MINFIRAKVAENDYRFAHELHKLHEVKTRLEKKPPAALLPTERRAVLRALVADLIPLRLDSEVSEA